MSGFGKIGSHSQKIIPVIIVITLADMLLGGVLSRSMSLIPDMVISRTEYWRLISFPLAPMPPEGMVLFLFTFLLIAPRLEEILKGGIFLSIMPALIFLQGVIHTLVFWKSHYALSGMEGISFFILTLFIFLNPETKFKVRFAPSLRLVFIITALISLWGSIKFYQLYDAGSEAVLISSASALFGILTASLCYLQIRFLRKFIHSRDSEDDFEIPNPEELRLAMISAEKSYRANSRKEDNDISDDNDLYELSSEERLDYILDKILESGQESLTPGEIYFLNNYSK